MQTLKQYRAAEALERQLGDPLNDANTLSFKNAMSWDEAEAFPQPAVDLLYRLGVNHHYVPASYGGRFTSYEEFQSLARSVARRDLATAVTFSTLVWSTLVWVGGDEQQKRRMAKTLRWTKEALCLAYSEEHHGADLIANECRAEKTAQGWRLNGEKWPINRATRSGGMAVLAKTGRERDSRSLSLFMVDKLDLDPAAYTNLPRVKTYGLRGCDISGVRFDNCQIPERSLIGDVGQGLELALRAFQVTRTLCAGLSLGVADTALRSTLDFALNRKLYGGTVFDIPNARRMLGEAFIDILICDYMATAAVRGLHVSTEQFSVWSAVAKYFVPATLERTVQELSVVLGARHFMRERHQHGIFQKMLRDGAVVGLFDGSSQVNLHALGLQLRHTTKARRNAGPDTARDERLATIFDLGRVLPSFDGRRLDLFSRGRDDVMQGFASALEHLHGLDSGTEVDGVVLGHLLRLTDEAMQALLALDALLDGPQGRALNPQSSQLFTYAKQYCVLHGAATCLHMWLYNRARLDGYFAAGEWLALALQRLLGQLRPQPDTLPDAYHEHAAERLKHLHDHQKLFSIVPLQLAPSHSNEEEKHHDRANTR